MSFFSSGESSAFLSLFVWAIVAHRSTSFGFEKKDVVILIILGNTKIQINHYFIVLLSSNTYLIDCIQAALLHFKLSPHLFISDGIGIASHILNEMSNQEIVLQRKDVCTQIIVLQLWSGMGITTLCLGIKFILTNLV